MKRRTLGTSVLVVAALLAPGYLTTASADVVNLYNLNVTLNGSAIFTDNFSQNQVLAGGDLPGKVLPSGINFPDGSSANYAVIGTVTETGTSPTLLNTAKGALIAQSSPGFHPLIGANIVTLLTGATGSPFSLTKTSSFSTSALFNVTVPATVGGFYQVNLSDRVLSNFFLGDVISMLVQNCDPTECPGGPGPYIALADANAFAGTTQTIARVPLDTSNQQILLELTKPDAGSDTVEGQYAYVNGGVEGPLMTLGTYSGLFTGPGTLDYTQSGVVQLAPVPEPSSLALLAASAPGVLGLMWRRRRKATGSGSSSQQVTSL